VEFLHKLLNCFIFLFLLLVVDLGVRIGRYLLEVEDRLDDLDGGCFDGNLFVCKLIFPLQLALLLALLVALCLLPL